MINYQCEFCSISFCGVWERKIIKEMWKLSFVTNKLISTPAFKSLLKIITSGEWSKLPDFLLYVLSDGISWCAYYHNNMPVKPYFWHTGWRGIILAKWNYCAWYPKGKEYLNRILLFRACLICAVRNNCHVCGVEGLIAKLYIKKSQICEETFYRARH